MALDQIIKGLNQILKPSHKVKIALETMAGKGTQVGINFDELKYIIDRVYLSDKVGVCFDTCHMFDNNYNWHDSIDDILTEFDTKIGLDKLFVMHINDSKFPMGEHKDRHANLGYGYIGFKTMMEILYHPKLNNIVKILETPYCDGEAPYQAEIKMIKEQKFNDPFNKFYPVIIK